MVWAGITFNGCTDIVILPQKMSFDADFYIENVLPIVNRDGNRLIGPNMSNRIVQMNELHAIYSVMII